MKRKCKYFIFVCVGMLAALSAGGCKRQETASDMESSIVVGEQENQAVEDGGQKDSAAEGGEGSPAEEGSQINAPAEQEEIMKAAGAAEEKSEAASEEPEIAIVMVGDILLHTPVENSALQEDGTYNFDAIFSHTEEDIKAADLAIVNQEVIIGGKELGISGYPAFNSPYEAGDALVEAGFDVVCHGTNHALDKGKRGVSNCLDFWKENYADIAVLGINDSQEMQDDIYVYEQDGIRIAVLNYTYGTNGISMPGDMPYAVDMMDEKKVLSDIERAEREADFTIVCPHWGTEYKLEPDAYQKKWAKLFLENGADLVLGTHPHVIEPVEWMTDEETGHEMLVYYSLGNFVNWTSGTGAGIANRMVGGMAEVTVRRNDKGEAVISDYGIEALVCHLEKGVNGVTTYALAEYPDELAEKNAIIAQDAAFSKKYCETLCDKVWGELWH